MVGDNMCKHIWRKINDVWVCANCGATRLPNNKIIFDRDLPNYIKNRRKRRK
nr:MAG TPA: Rubredoxin [Caudoviricetes sp.]